MGSGIPFTERQPGSQLPQCQESPFVFAFSLSRCFSHKCTTPSPPRAATQGVPRSPPCAAQPRLPPCTAPVPNSTCPSPRLLLLQQCRSTRKLNCFLQLSHTRSGCRLIFNLPDSKRGCHPPSEMRCSFSLGKQWEKGKESVRNTASSAQMLPSHFVPLN